MTSVRTLPAHAASVVLGSAITLAAAGLAACHHDSPLVRDDGDAAVALGPPAAPFTMTLADGGVLVGQGPGPGPGPGPGQGQPQTPGDLAPTCSSPREPVAIPGGALAVGDGVRDDGEGRGAFFGVLRPSGAAAWAHVDVNGGSLQVHDLPPSDPDAPPPEIVTHGADRFLLYSRSAGPGAPRARLDASAPSLRLVLARLGVPGSAEAQTTAEIASQRDDSLDADAAFAGAAGGLVVWDEDEPLLRFGIIRAARIDTNGHLIGAPFTISADGTDAEAPRVLPLPGAGGGFVVVYRARKGEEHDGGLVDNSAEAPGERRAYRWLEAVIVPLAGSASDVGAVPTARRLTSPTGHAGTFDLYADGARGAAVLLHDDDAPKDAAGTTVSILRLPAPFTTSSGDASPPLPKIPVVASGAGSGAVSRLESVASCGAGNCDAVVYSGEDDAAHLARLGGSGGGAPGSSREPAFDGTDPIVRLPSGSILTFVRDHGGSLRTVTCQ